MHLDKDVTKYNLVNNKQYFQKLCCVIEPNISMQLLIKNSKLQ